MPAGRVALSLIFLLSALEAQATTPPPNSRQLDRLQRWLKSPSDTMRLEALREVSGLPAVHAAPLLYGAVSNSSAAVRAAAAWQLGGIRQPETVAALRPLLKDDNDRVRAAAAWSLSKTGGKAVLPDILPLCRDDASGIVRFRAVWGLGNIGDNSALPAVIAALGDYNASVRERAALIALETLADNSVPSRLQTLSTNIFAPTRRIVMYLLSRYPDKTSIPVLRAGLKDAEPLVRAEAALSLGKMRAGVTGLPALLGDPDEHVRGAAAYALGLVGDAAAKDLLRPLLKDDEAFVRAIAAESLQRLGDKSVKPPEGFKAAELFTYPIHSPEHRDLYR